MRLVSVKAYSPIVHTMPKELNTRGTTNLNTSWWWWRLQKLSTLKWWWGSIVGYFVVVVNGCGGALGVVVCVDMIGVGVVFEPTYC